MHILIVEDDVDIARLIAGQLTRSSFVPHVAASLADARGAIGECRFPLILIDRRLPDGDGLSLVSLIRGAQLDARVMILTALDTVGEKVQGLDAGADDYLTKPFDADELMARIRASLRRPGGEKTPPIVCGALSFDPASRVVFVKGEPIVLHGLELTLLESLLRNLRRTTSRRVLIADVYGRPNRIAHSNVLDSLVSRLRRRLIMLDAGVTIHPIRGVGYLLTEVNG